VADGSFSPFLIKMVSDVRLMLMMCLRVEILLYFQCLTSLVKVGCGLDDSLASFRRLEKDLKFEVASCNFQVF
jgi:hypothetical protein